MNMRVMGQYARGLHNGYATESCNAIAVDMHSGYATEFCNAIAVDILHSTRLLFRLLHRVLAVVTRLDYRKPTYT
jgi:hypothetical protein